MQSNLLGIISVEGIIGAGKSTIMNLLRTELGSSYRGINIVYIDEPVDLWTTSIRVENISSNEGIKNIIPLEVFYEDQSKYALSFQLYALITRVEALKEIIDSITVPTIIITERSCNSDMHVFAKMHVKLGNIDSMMILTYNTIFSHITKDLHQYFKYYVHIQVSSEIAYNRIERRDRTCESCVSLDYLRQLDSLHRELYDKHIGDAKVLYLDWGSVVNNNTIRYLKDKFTEMIDEICE